MFVTATIGLPYLYVVSMNLSIKPNIEEMQQKEVFKKIIIN